LNSELKQQKYKSIHKIVNNIEYKLCTICNEFLPMNNEYFYKNKSNSMDGYNTWCKKCSITKATKNKQDNPERTRNYDKKQYKKRNEYFQRRNIEQRDYLRENLKRWYDNNADKVKEYRESRMMHKKHDMTEDELLELYDYAKYRCMYCGMTEEDAIKIYNQRLHKDHAYNDCGNGIENCILACMGCNCSKRDKDWDDWYNEANPRYTKRRYNKIFKWLMKFV